MISRQILIKGKVQGVFFRASAKKLAEHLALKGWVKNTRNGDVEAIVTGNQNAVMEFIEWCRHGPREAVVKEVIVTELPVSTYSGFSIVRD
jgi:acylphosphatase